MKLLFFAVLCISVFTVSAQNIRYISFKQEKVNYALKEFYISNVTDDRADTKTDGIINKGAGMSEKVMFTNGVAVSLNAFMGKNISQDKTTQPIVLHISKLNAGIKKEGRLWEVDAAVTFAFYAADKKVIEYTGHGTGKTDKDPAAYIEKFIRQSVETDLKKFDSWWPQNKGKIATNPQVKVNVTISKTTDKPNCIAYSVQRPLQIIDFTGPAEGSRAELAATLSGIGVYYTGQPQNGQLALNITITPYFDKSKSWFREEGKSPKVLAHEQTHFDITAIKACELANTIRNTVFTQDNYEKLINQLQQQNAQESNEEESRYDAETNHGTVQDKQQMWQDKIKAQVKAAGCY